ncbi:universal stress protein [Streptomyces sp. NPDC002187]|uniref:universal stress protein n=1 Tax=Streptomyces sp. NPDC002187 TaxID=3364637 RepID=UPI0036C3DE85
MMQSPLVVGVDGSESSLRATDWAADEAARHGLPLRLIYATRWELYEGAALAASLGRSDTRVMGENIVGMAGERAQLRAPDVKVTTEVLPEDTVKALLHESRQATALITGSRGRGEFTGLLLGSVSLALAARAHCPVIVVRGDDAALAGTHGRVLLGVGDTDVDSAAVRFAFREAKARGCTLCVVRGWRRPSHESADHALPEGDPARYYEVRAETVLDEALAAAARDNPDVLLQASTPEGSARKALVDLSAAADLLVVGARRREGQFGLQLGRVGHTVLHHAACPVAVVPHHA